MFDVSPIVVFFVEKIQRFYQFDLAQARLTPKLQKVHVTCIFWCKSYHYRLHRWGAIDDWVLPIFGYCSNIVDFKALKLQVYMGCHQQYTYHQKVYGMCIILMWVPSPLSLLLRRYGWLKFTQIYIFHNYSQLQSWITPNLYGVSPTMWRSSQSAWKGLHFGTSSVTIA